MKMKFWILPVLLVVAASLHAETGYDAWLRYAPLDAAHTAQYHKALPAVVTTLGDSAVEVSARNELVRGVRGMLERTLREESRVPPEGAIVLGTLDELQRKNIDVSAYLERYDSHTLLSLVGNSILMAGDTGTNVGDLIIYMLG